MVKYFKCHHHIRDKVTKWPAKVLASKLSKRFKIPTVHFQDQFTVLYCHTLKIPVAILQILFGTIITIWYYSIKYWQYCSIYTNQKRWISIFTFQTFQIAEQKRLLCHMKHEMGDCGFKISVLEVESNLGKI